jgi:hypothetical protein
VKLSAILEPLVKAGVDAATILLAVKAWEDQQADALQQRRTADAARQTRKRERDASRDVTLRHSDRSLTRDRVAPAEDKPIDTDTASSKNTSSRDLAEFRGALASLDADQVNGLVKVRKAKKAPITGYAARLLIKAANDCDLSLSQAADMCIERNWLTVKPDWLAKPAARGSPQHGPNVADGFAALHTEIENRNDTRPRTSDEGTRGAISYLSRVQGG